MNRSFFKQATAALFAVVLMVGTTACANKAAEVNETSAIRVHTKIPTRSSVIQKADFTGRIMPDDSVSVFGKASGTVLKTYVEVGDTVKAGQLLYELDPKDYQIQLELSKLEYESALNGLDAAENGTGNAITELEYQSRISAAKNAYESARATLELMVDDDFNMSTYKKARQKYKDAVETWEKAKTTDNYTAMLAAERNYNEELDQYGQRSMKNSYYVGFESAYDNYEAALKAYEIYKSTTVNENTQSYDLKRQQAKLGYEAMLQTMDNLKIYAPIGGVIEKKNVSTNGMYAPSSPGYIVSNKEILVVNFAVSSNVAAAMTLGDEVAVEHGQGSYRAEITEIGTMIDAASGLIPIKARLVDKADMLSGVSVKLTAITAKSENSLTIPLTALYYDNGSAYVYTVKDNISVKTPIKLGIISGDVVEVLSGLSDNSEVITTWNPNLIDGAAVETSEEV